MCLTLNQFKSTLAKPCGGILPLGPCPPVPPSVLFVPFCPGVSLGAAQARGSIQRSPERENYRTKPSCNLQTPASLSSGYLSIQSHSRGFKGIQSYSKLFKAIPSIFEKKRILFMFPGHLKNPLRLNYRVAPPALEACASLELGACGFGCSFHLPSGGRKIPNQA